MSDTIDYSVLDSGPKEVKMLTTTDNPFNPFTQFDEWYLFDSEKGYNSLSKLARFVNVNDETNEEEYDVAYDLAIRRIIACDPLGLYTAVTGTEVPKYVIKENKLNIDL